MWVPWMWKLLEACVAWAVGRLQTWSDVPRAAVRVAVGGQSSRSKRDQALAFDAVFESSCVELFEKSPTHAKVSRGIRLLSSLQAPEPVPFVARVV